MRAALAGSQAAERRLGTVRSRLELSRARHDTRTWVVKRRERTRQLIELGGLVAKADIVELAGDDRAAIFGAMLEVAVVLRGPQRERSLTLWRRRGKRAFGKTE